MANFITKKVPNTITCCNLLCGCVSIVLALNNEPLIAFLFIILGAVFDFFDGMTARLLGVQSAIGKELDSLADVTTFGVAPSAMLYTLLTNATYPEYLFEVKNFLPFTAFIIAAASALRLANFNIDERQTSSFIGLPTPANALFWGAYIIYFNDKNDSIFINPAFLFIIICLSAWILNAEIKMFALKFKHWTFRENKLRYLFILSCIPLIIFLKTVAFSVIIVWYVILSVINSGIKQNGNN